MLDRNDHDGPTMKMTSLHTSRFDLPLDPQIGNHGNMAGSPALWEGFAK
jgi:hypothetical protein